MGCWLVVDGGCVDVGFDGVEWRVKKSGVEWSVERSGWSGGMSLLVCGPC